MKNQIEIVNVKNLVPDMILAKSFKQNNISLLNKGTILTYSIISKLQKAYPLNNLYIYKNENLKEIDDILQINYEKIAATKKTFVQYTGNMNKFIKSIKYNSKPDMNTLRDMSKNILHNLKDYSSILKVIFKDNALDEYLIKHSVNVGVLSSMLGKWMNLSDKHLKFLTYAALLHDIGKTKIDPEILNKTSKLTENDLEIMKNHPLTGYNIIKTIPYINNSVGIAVLMHHEKIDGSGYPLGLNENQIHIFAKILSITDTFDNMISNKINSEKLSPFKALEIMQQDYFGKFDMNCLITFIKQMSNYYTGEMVKLNSGKIGKIIKMDINYISKPLITIDSNFIDLKNENNIFIKDLI
jgi:HD-GYP domain-containing protein (c-di-GMP phosphodiesterase class II)